MITMRELLYEVKVAWPLLLLKAGLILIALIGAYNIASFQQNTDEAIDANFSKQMEYDLYSICDTLTEENDFSRFRKSEKNMQTACSFYNLLNNEEYIAFLSMFNQPVAVSHFKGSQKFRYAYGTEMSDTGVYEDSGLIVEDIKAFQLNEKAFRFYNLTVSEGQEPDWEAINYQGDEIPVLLGSNYKAVYGLGGEIEGLYYFKKIKFKVIGFLESDSAVYYKGEPNCYLDSYVILPYPAKLSTSTGGDFDFMGMLAFSMINGDIAAPNDLTSQDVLNILYAISSQSNFEDYSLLNAPEYLVQLSMMRNLIGQNLSLVIAVQGAITISLLCAIALIDSALSKRRAALIAIMSIKGRKAGSCAAKLLPCMTFPCLISLAFFIALSFWLPNLSLGALAATFLLFLSISVLDAFVQYLFTFKPIGNALRQEQ